MRSENYRDLVKCSVQIELANGRQLVGIVEKPRSKSLVDFLNDGSAFVEVELFDGGVVQLAKQAVLTCQPKTAERTDHLKTAAFSVNAENPLATLGLKDATSREDIRHAYLARIRLYHTDRYSGVELPKEVADYLGSMAKLINAAYTDCLAMCERHKAAAAQAEAQASYEPRRRSA